MDLVPHHKLPRHHLSQDFHFLPQIIYRHHDITSSFLGLFMLLLDSSVHAEESHSYVGFIQEDMDHRVTVVG
jgi:hypothetical protein